MKTYLTLLFLAATAVCAKAQPWLTSSTNVYYDGGKVGIGSGASPQASLHIVGTERLSFRLYKSGNTTNYLSLWQGEGAAAIEAKGTKLLYLGYDEVHDILMSPVGGKVGIGTLTPVSQLHIASNSDHAITLSRSNSQYGFRILRNAAEGAVYFQIGNTTSTWETKIRIGEGEGTNTALMLNPTNGNVLIGKQSQVNTAYKLDVNGSVRANEMIVNTTGADFVFESNYNLPTLEQVEEFIRNNKHLPDIEPASEMQNNGVEVGKLETKLLQKIEEMTLYMIEMKKEISYLKDKVADLEKK